MTSTTPYTSWQLAHLADCAEPDEHDGRGFEPPAESREGSHGARFLRLIEDGVREAIEDGIEEDPSDVAHEIADAAVPVYTHALWETFVDLAAYQEDPSELGYDDTGDMTKLAGVCLYMIGSRLAAALIEAHEDEDA